MFHVVTADRLGHRPMVCRPPLATSLPGKFVQQREKTGVRISNKLNYHILCGFPLKESNRLKFRDDLRPKATADANTSVDGSVGNSIQLDYGNRKVWKPSLSYI